MAKRPKPQPLDSELPTQPETASPPKAEARPLVFVSHDSRDAELAEAFSNLLTDASGGFLKSFRSSDRRGTAGIEFGAEWYTAIMSKLDDATDVVALLTLNSIDRPWILYEAGVAKGKLNKQVFGVVVGIPLERASRGPFAQFQNCDDDEVSLTKLVLQLIRRNSDAEPREEAVRRQVNAFREIVTSLVGEATSQVNENVPDPNAVSKLFEEIKVILAGLPERMNVELTETFGGRGPKRRRRVNPHMIEDMLYVSFHSSNNEERAAFWLMFLSIMREDFPWIYELGLDVHRAMKRGPSETRVALERFIRTVERSHHHPMFEEMMDKADYDAIKILRYLPDMLQSYFMSSFEDEHPELLKVAKKKGKGTGA